MHKTRIFTGAVIPTVIIAIGSHGRVTSASTHGKASSL